MQHMQAHLKPLRKRLTKQELNRRKRRITARSSKVRVIILGSKSIREKEKNG